ncbi:ATP/GTP-binding protein, partial [Streptomyces sp. SID3343]|nr:ATP/GTP-binding protein [Streptomyces sp. SID3343]
MFDNARPLHPDPHNKPEPEPPAETGYRPHMHVVPGLPEAEDVLYAPPPPQPRTWPDGFQRDAPPAGAPDAGRGQTWSVDAASLTPAVGRTPPLTPANGTPVVPPEAAPAGPDGRVNGARHPGGPGAMFTVP